MDETHASPARLGGGHDAFCLSNPKTREFLRKYVAEVAAIFPGPYFNAGHFQSRCDPERILVDDSEWADFGTCGFLEKYYDAVKEAKISSITVSLK